MRKDTRIGVAIGLVLFAVLIVYAVVAPKSTKKKVTLDKTGKAVAPVDENAARGGSLSATGETPAGTTGAPVAEAGTDAAPAGGDAEANDPKRAAKWAALLGATEKLETPVLTRTPPMSHPDADVTHAPADDHPVKRSGTTANPDNSSSRDTNLDPIRRDAKPTASAATTHRIQQGETYVSIARAYYGDGRYAAEIQKANASIDPRRLRPGTSIQLPDKAHFIKSDTTKSDTTAATTASARLTKTPAKAPVVSASEYSVQSSDNLYKISMKLYGRGDRANAIYELNRQQIGPDSGRLRPGMVLQLPAASDRLTTASAR